MVIFLQKQRPTLTYRILCACIAFAFTFSVILPPTPVSAQMIPRTIMNLPLPGTMVSLTSAFNPPLVEGITIHPENPLKFDFLISPGDEHLEGMAFRKESKKLIKYFLASLTVPDNELWVNLSPYEKNRIIPKKFGQTEMGRDMLAQDYILKQLSASLMYPEDELGKKFWNRVYKKAYEQYGTTEIPMNTFNKIWIVPEKAVVYEHDQTAFVVESHLKVMLEEDYIALKNNLGETQFGLDQVTKDDAEVISGVSSEVVREVLIPEIENEVNEGEIFTQLRQIYNSVILATWYKDNLRASLLGQIYVDKSKTKGVDVQDKQVNRKIYDQYIEAFKKGVYNYIKEDYDLATKQVIPRKYFSGGNNLGKTRSLRVDVEKITPGQTKKISSPIKKVGVDLYAYNRTNTKAIETAERLLSQEVASTVITSSPVEKKVVPIEFEDLRRGDDIKFSIRADFRLIPGHGLLFGNELYDGKVEDINLEVKSFDEESIKLLLLDDKGNASFATFNTPEFGTLAKVVTVSSPVVADQKKKTVLVVDDYETLRLFYEEMISEEYNVVAATNGIEALKRVRESRIDLVLTDGYMPEMGGVELTENLQKEFPGIPVIISSARKEDVIDGLKKKSLKVAAVLGKTTTNQVLLDTIKKVLEQAKRSKVERNRELLHDVLGDALYTKINGMVEETSGTGPAQINIDDKMWKEILLKFLVAYSNKAGGAEKLEIIEVFKTLYAGRFVSYIQLLESLKMISKQKGVLSGEEIERDVTDLFEDIVYHLAQSMGDQENRDYLKENLSDHYPPGMYDKIPLPTREEVTERFSKKFNNKELRMFRPDGTEIENFGEVISSLEKVNFAVGVPSVDEGEDIKNPARKAYKGLQDYFFRGDIKLVANMYHPVDNNTSDHFIDEVRELQNNNPQNNIYALVVSTGRDEDNKPIKGKGNNFINFFYLLRLAQINEQFRGAAVIDADLKSITKDGREEGLTKEWIRELIHPVVIKQQFTEEEGKKLADFVSPYYYRHIYDGTLTNNIVMALLAMAKVIRQPIGGDFGFGPKALESFLNKKWGESTTQYGIDIFMSMASVVEELYIVEATLGAKIHNPSAPKIDRMLTEVLSSAFGMFIRYKTFFTGVTKVDEVPRIQKIGLSPPQLLAVDYEKYKQKVLGDLGFTGEEQSFNIKGDFLTEEQILDRIAGWGISAGDDKLKKLLEPFAASSPVEVNEGVINAVHDVYGIPKENITDDLPISSNKPLDLYNELEKQFKLGPEVLPFNDIVRATTVEEVKRIVTQTLSKEDASSPITIQPAVALKKAYERNTADFDLRSLSLEEARTALFQAAKTGQEIPSNTLLVIGYYAGEVPRETLEYIYPMVRKAIDTASRFKSQKQVLDNLEKAEGRIRAAIKQKKISGFITEWTAKDHTNRYQVDAQVDGFRSKTAEIVITDKQSAMDQNDRVVNIDRPASSLEDARDLALSVRAVINHILKRDSDFRKIKLPSDQLSYLITKMGEMAKAAASSPVEINKGVINAVHEVYGIPKENITDELPIPSNKPLDLYNELEKQFKLGPEVLPFNKVVDAANVDDLIKIVTQTLSREDTSSPVARIKEINYLLREINKEIENPGSGNLPRIVVMSDYHGEVNLFLQYIADAISQEIGKTITLDHTKFPQASIEQQLANQGVNISDSKIPFYLLGDFADRGPYGVKATLVGIELDELGLTGEGIIIGNHDEWMRNNVLGFHLPIYKGYNFHGHKRSQKFVEDHWDDREIAEFRFKWWAKKLAEYTRIQRGLQAEIVTINGAEKSFKDFRKRLHMELYPQLNDAGLTDEEDKLLQELIGLFRATTEVYTGFNEVGLMSVEWWMQRAEKVSHIAFEKEGRNSPGLKIWQELRTYTNAAAKRVSERLTDALRKDRWWWQVFNDMNHQVYRSAEWWAKDWLFHSGWGESVLKELNELEAGDIVWDETNYMDNPHIQKIVSYWNTKYKLQARDPYGNFYTHSWLPVNKTTGKMGFTYKGLTYEGARVWEGLKVVEKDRRDLGMPFPEKYEGIDIVNSWYADETTEIKPSDVEYNIKTIGLEKIYTENGITGIWFNGHNPQNKLTEGHGLEGFKTQQGKHVLIATDKGLSWKKFKDVGSYTIIDADGVRQRGFSGPNFKEIINDPPTLKINKDKQDSKKYFIEKEWNNEPLAKDDFLQMMKTQLKEERARLQSSSSPVGLLEGIPLAFESLNDIDLAGEKVLIRANLNVPIEDGVITDDTRLKEIVPLIEYLLARNAVVILVGHHGRLEKKDGIWKDDRLSVAPTAKFFETEFQGVPVTFHEHSVTPLGLHVSSRDMKKGINIIENLRFRIPLSHSKEWKSQKSREKFAASLAGLTGEKHIFIAEAAADMGSGEAASIKSLPFVITKMGGRVSIGPSSAREFTKVDHILKRGINIVIFGGAKPEKLVRAKGIIDHFSSDVLFGSSTTAAFEADKEGELEKLFAGMEGRILKAVDYSTTTGKVDIGQGTIKLFSNKLDTLKPGDVVLANGTMGWVEGGHTAGTDAIFHKLKELAEKRGVTVVFIGGDASANARKRGLKEGTHIIYFTGGGVILKLLAGEKLVGIEALREAAAAASSPLTGEKIKKLNNESVANDVRSIIAKTLTMDVRKIKNDSVVEDLLRGKLSDTSVLMDTFDKMFDIALSNIEEDLIVHGTVGKAIDLINQKIAVSSSPITIQPADARKALKRAYALNTPDFVPSSLTVEEALAALLLAAKTGQDIPSNILPVIGFHADRLDRKTLEHVYPVVRQAIDKASRVKSEALDSLEKVEREIYVSMIKKFETVWKIRDNTTHPYQIDVQIDAFESTRAEIAVTDKQSRQDKNTRAIVIERRAYTLEDAKGLALSVKDVMGHVLKHDAKFKKIKQSSDQLSYVIMKIREAARTASSPLEAAKQIIEKEKPLGGINLDPALLDLQIKRDGNGVPLPVQLQPIEVMNIEGLMPVIINVTPITNLPMLLGLDVIDNEERPVHSADSDPQTTPFGLGFIEKYRNKYIRGYEYQEDNINA